MQTFCIIQINSLFIKLSNLSLFVVHLCATNHLPRLYSARYLLIYRKQSNAVVLIYKTNSSHMPAATFIAFMSSSTELIDSERHRRRKLIPNFPNFRHTLKAICGEPLERKRCNMSLLIACLLRGSYFNSCFLHQNQNSLI